MIYFKYLKYLIRHKWYVFVACCRVTKDLKYKWRLIILGIVHDWSKFRPSEYIPYARYFYGDYPKHNEVTAGFKYNYTGLYHEDIERRFDKAWLYHIHRNKHHWQHWLLQEDDGPLKKIPIPMLYLLEMIADWRGAGMAITGKDNIVEWYGSNRDKIQVRDLQRKFIEKKIGFTASPIKGGQ